MRSTQTSILIVNWNGAAFLPDLLHSIEDQGVSQTIVVDNASTDRSIEILKKFPDVTTIANSENRGYGAAANQGLEICKTPYALLLNADVKLLPGSIPAMESFLETHPDAGLVAPQLVFEDGSLQPSLRSFPTAFSIAMYMSFLDRLFPTQYRKKAKEHAAIQEVDQPMGAAMMFRMEVLKDVGFFDPQFFLYMEEVDLCYRIKQKGYKIFYLPEAKVLHYAGGSSQQDWERSQRNFLDSLNLYFKKHSPTEKQKLSWLLPPAFFLRALILLFTGRFRESRFYFRNL